MNQLTKARIPQKSQLERTTFSTSRLLEYFTVKELKMQIGCGPENWPLALTKELIDNALDGCESIGVQPQITVILDGDSVTVKDNGPGLPEETLRGSLDYTKTVSDKSAYISPTRGQLGNALKCLWAAPWVYNGERGAVDIATSAYAYRIQVSVDRIAQTPKMEMIAIDTPRPETGTVVKTEWDPSPELARLVSGENRYFYIKRESLASQVLDLLQSYAAFNTHAGFRLVEDGKETVISEPMSGEQEKWRPDWPTSPHWYSTGDLVLLISAYIANGQGRKSIREFVSEFRGLSGTAKQKKVVAGAGLSGKCLDDMVKDGAVDEGPVSALLVAMCGESAPVKAAKLGIIGEESMVSRMRAIDGVNLVDYAKRFSEDTRRPTVVEMALGVRADDEDRRIRFGVNFSPVIGNPLKMWPVWLQKRHLDTYDPVSMTVHMACPRFEFTNRGKSMIGGDDE